MLASACRPHGMLGIALPDREIQTGHPVLSSAQLEGGHIGADKQTSMRGPSSQLVGSHGEMNLKHVRTRKAVTNPIRVLASLVQGFGS